MIARGTRGFGSTTEGGASGSQAAAALRQHDIFYNTLSSYETSSQAFPTIVDHHVLNQYATAANDRRDLLEREAWRATCDTAIDGTRGGGTRESTLKREASEARLERDFWRLLKILSSKKLLNDIDKFADDKARKNAIDDLPLSASIRTVYETVCANSQTFRKGYFLVEWLKECASDRINHPPKPNAVGGTGSLGLASVSIAGTGVWSQTHRAILREDERRKKGVSVSQMHPDGQISSTGQLLRLDGSDAPDQEVLLKCIWSCIRAGDVQQARDLAHDHEYYWLASMLDPISIHYYHGLEGDLDGAADTVSGECRRVGNTRRPLWQRACWKYAEKLSETSKNSISGVLESSIFASLSDNTEVLLSSPLINTWSDRLWVMVKAAQNREVMRVTKEWRNRLKSQSNLHPGCDAKIIKIEDEIFQNTDRQLAGINLGTSENLFDKGSKCCVAQQKNPASQTSQDLTVEAFIQHMQVAVIGGLKGIKSFMQQIAMPFLKDRDLEQLKQRNVGNDSTQSSHHGCILRLLCHFCLWLRYSTPDIAPSSSTTTTSASFNFSSTPITPQRGGDVTASGRHSLLSECVPEDLLSKSVEAYIDHLIYTKQRSLVATYACALSRPKRIEKYVSLLLAIHNDSHALTRDPHLTTTFASTFSSSSLSSSNSLFNPASSSSTLLQSDSEEVIKLAASLFSADDVMEITRRAVSTAATTDSFQPTSVPSSSTSSSSSSSATPQHRTVRFDNVGGGGYDTNIAGLRDSDVEVLDTEDSPRISQIKARKGTPHHKQKKTSSLEAPLWQTTGTPSKRISGTGGEMDMGIGMGMGLGGDDDVSHSDLQKMESIRWLTTREDHYLEAIRKANSLMTSFFLKSPRELMARSIQGFLLPDAPRIMQSDAISVPGESAAVAIRCLLSNYLPSDAFTVCYNYLNSLPHEEEGKLRDLYANERKQAVWSSFAKVTEHVKMWLVEVEKFRADQNRLLGNADTMRASLSRYQNSITLFATMATDGIRRLLCCDDDHVSRGLTNVWFEERECQVERLEDEMHRSVESMTNNPWSSAFLHDYALKEMGDLEIQLKQYEEDTGNRIISSRICQSIHTLREAMMQRGSVNAPSSSCNPDDEANVTAFLNIAKQGIQDIVDSHKALVALICEMASHYLLISRVSAEILLLLVPDNHDLALKWLSVGISLADLLADERRGFQFYRIIPSARLRKLLADIQKSVLRMHELGSKKFEIL